MFPPKFALCVLCCLLAIAPAVAGHTATSDRIQLTLDTSEADQVLAILALRSQGKPVPESEWQKLFATAPYLRLKQREKAIGERFHDPTIAFTDDDFKRFVLSDELLPRAAALSSTLDRWKKADLRQDASQDLAYLPTAATIRAKVYPVIKPGTNSFVWDLSSDPTIFLYLDPEVSREKFENTVTHELHHIGLGSVGPIYEAEDRGFARACAYGGRLDGQFWRGFCHARRRRRARCRPARCQFSQGTCPLGTRHGPVQRRSSLRQPILPRHPARQVRQPRCNGKEGRVLLRPPGPVVHRRLQDVGDGRETLWAPGPDRHDARSALPARALQPGSRRAECCG